MLAIGTLLQQRYEVVRLLGHGGMGAVYQAVDQRLKAPVAIKQILHPDVSFGRAFAHEARMLAALRHPAIPTVSDYFSEGEGHFLVMQFIPGADLATTITQRAMPFPLDHVLQWADLLLDALEYLHGQNPPIIHRDITPHNLKLTTDGDIMLLDFGLSKAVGHQSSVGSIAGDTPTYAALELIQGDGIDQRSDLFSLAATLYHLLTGTKPIDALQRTIEVLAGQADPLLLPNAVDHYIPPAIIDILRQALALDSAQRPASATVVRTLLRQASHLASGMLPPSDMPGEQTGRAEQATITTSTPPNNLPMPLLPLIGRMAEVATLIDILRQADSRIVTLTGPGGSGKTRLALQVAAEMINGVGSGAEGQAFDGVFFVALAPIRDSTLVIATIARTLDLYETGNQPILEILREYLHDKRILLILDNFEHLIAAVSQLIDLLADTRRLTCLITSREALRVRGEMEFPVLPLALPDLLRLPGLAELVRYAAVDLFIRRAQTARLDFALTEANAAAVAAICVRLDGLPLAIELAAARSRLLTPQALLDRLSHRLKLLTGGARDLPQRQQTLRGTIDWSYDLLDAAEQRLFQRLAVFVGGCTLGAAEAICNADGAALDVLDGLTSLLDKNLLYRNHQEVVSVGEPHFLLLETIWEYAYELLSASDELEPLRRVHATYYVTLAQQADRALRGADQVVWLDRLDQEHDNFRAVLDWAAGPTGDVELGFQICGTLWRFWQPRGFLKEGRERVTRLVAAAPHNAAPTEARANALTTAGILAHFQGDLGAAEALYEEVLPIRRTLGVPRGIASALNNLGIVAMDRGDYDAARGLYEQCLAIERTIGDEGDIAGSLMNLGNIAYFQNDYATAQALHEESLALARKLGAKHIIAYALMNLGGVAYDLGDYVTARARCTESVEIERELGDQWGIASALSTLGDAAREQEDYATAQTAYAEALSIMRIFGDKRVLGHMFESSGGLAAKQRDLIRAVTLAGIAAALRIEIGVPPTPAEQRYVEGYLKDAREALGDDTFNIAWNAGKAMELDHAFVYALEENL